MDTHLLWWLVSRAAGVVAMVLISVAVLLGLAMSTKLLRRPGAGKVLMRLHEHLALLSFAAIGSTDSLCSEIPGCVRVQAGC